MILSRHWFKHVVLGFTLCIHTWHCASEMEITIVEPVISWQQHENISKVIFSPDSRLIVTKSTRNDEPVTVRNTLTGEISCAWARSYRVSNDVAPNGRWLFIDTAGRLNAHMRDITNCNYIRYIDLDLYHHFDSLFSRDGRFLAGTAHPRRPIFNRNRWAYIYDLEQERIVNHVIHRSRNLFGMWDDKFHLFSDGETVLLWLEVRKTVRNRSGEKRTYDRRVECAEKKGHVREEFRQDVHKFSTTFTHSSKEIVHG